MTLLPLVATSTTTRPSRRCGAISTGRACARRCNSGACHDEGTTPTRPRTAEDPRHSARLDEFSSGSPLYNERLLGHDNVRAPAEPATRPRERLPPGHPRLALCTTSSMKSGTVPPPWRSG
ncbi:hypothetical protein FOCC_FOCC016904 [Frankliniella occidentalis]|nr:hypothetical protein FOCC_FOCC016904 [Frankliniella occidentalis]